MSLPPGLVSVEPMCYGWRRWNGSVWCKDHVDAYNNELERIVDRHEAGFDVTHLVDGLYNLANRFDMVN